MGLAGKRSDVGRQLELASPSVQRIVIAVNDIDGNVTLGQALHLAAKRDKRTQAPVFRIVEISGKDQKVRLRLNRVIDNSLECAQRCRLQLVSKLRRRVGKPAERTVQMQVRSMDET